MPKLTESEIYNHLIAGTSDLVYESILSGNNTIRNLFEGLKLSISNHTFNDSFLNDLVLFIDKNPELKPRVLSELSHLPINILGAFSSYTFSDFVNTYPYRLEVVQHLLQEAGVDHKDIHYTGYAVERVSACSLLLKVEWPNLTTNERMSALYAHLLNFNNVFPNGGGQSPYRASSTCCIEHRAGQDPFKFTYSDVIPLLQSYYNDLIPNSFFKRLTDVSAVMGGMQFVDLPMLCTIYDSLSISSEDLGDLHEQDFEFIIE